MIIKELLANSPRSNDLSSRSKIRKLKRHMVTKELVFS